MSLQLIDHSPDLKRLRDEGYSIEFKNGYLFLYDIPYVNVNKEVAKGTLVSSLNMNGERTNIPDNHVIDFMGDYPCNKDGSSLEPIRHSTQDRQIMEGVIVNHSFSNKPVNGYPDYYEKFKRYADVISAPAKSIDSSLTEKTFRVVTTEKNESVFQYVDTNSSRANIYQINLKLSGQRIAIIGLGGTGAYILDLIAKTTVNEIHLFDGDAFQQHNAFRSPGAASIEILKRNMNKVDYYHEVYSRIHRHVVPHCAYIDQNNYSQLSSMSYVFICIDRNSVKRDLMTHLIENGISFIDVGLGVNVVDDFLIGSVRVTTATPSKNDHLTSRVSMVDNDNDYSTNIQIADLNALNATLAVIKWKKLSGFYNDLENEHNSTYSINVSQLLNDDLTT